MGKGISYVILYSVAVIIIAAGSYAVFINFNPSEDQSNPDDVTITLTDSAGRNAEGTSAVFLEGKYNFSTESMWSDAIVPSGPAVLIKDPVKYTGEHDEVRSMLYRDATTCYDLDRLQVGGFDLRDGSLVNVGEGGGFNAVRIGSITADVEQRDHRPGSVLKMDITCPDGAVFREHGVSLIYEYVQDSVPTLALSKNDLHDIVLRMSGGAGGQWNGSLTLNAYILYPNTVQSLSLLELQPLCFSDKDGLGTSVVFSVHSEFEKPSARSFFFYRFDCMRLYAIQLF